MPANHLARRIDQAVARLDLSTILGAYASTGSPAHAPDLLLRAALYEVQRGQHSPATWFREAYESEPMRWLLRGPKMDEAVDKLLKELAQEAKKDGK